MKADGSESFFSNVPLSRFSHYEKQNRVNS